MVCVFFCRPQRSSGRKFAKADEHPSHQELPLKHRLLRRKMGHILTTHSYHLEVLNDMGMLDILMIFFLDDHAESQ